jgi:putative PIN family toxin of toxin-antitoxin system
LTLILDTNVWLAWLVFADPRLAALVEAIESGQARVIATRSMLDEFAEVAARPIFKLSPDQQASARERLDDTVVLLAAAPDCRLPCSDRDDQVFIDLAVAHRVDWLLSRDKALLRLRKLAARRFGVRIGLPEDWRALPPATAPPPRDVMPIISQP